MGVLDWLREVAPRQRWFADKTRVVAEVNVVWEAPITADGAIALLVAEYRFAGGDPGLYLIPVETESMQEATAHPAFTSWLLNSMTERLPLPEALAWTRLTNDDLTPLVSLPASLLGVEQSNTSIRFGDQLVVKLNRKLTIGPSPEAELAAVIAKAQDSSFSARTHGTLVLRGIAASPICIAICSEYVPNLGDAWGYLLSQLIGPAETSGLIRTEIEKIATATAAMHVGLTSDPWRGEVSPEPISPDDIERWEANAVASIERLQESLATQPSRHDPAAQGLINLLEASAPNLRQELHGFHSLRGAYKTRIHGDYHLGQLLRTTSGRYVVVDFDGEPGRTLAERRDKYSPLRDVAGMLRSIAYARGTAEQADPIKAGRSAWLEWERHARDAFLSRYHQSMANEAMALLPAASEDMRQALAALELEKAIYECEYELSNRPDWLWLPLSRLVHAG